MIKKIFIILLFLLIPFTASKASIQEDLRCLSLAAYHEAKGEGKQGMLAVIHVTLNRVKDPRFPKTPCGVISQPNQYSWYKYRPRVKDYETYAVAKQLAKEVLSGKHKDVTNGALFFYATSIRKPKDFGNVKCTARIGGHIFYKPSK